VHVVGPPQPVPVEPDPPGLVPGGLEPDRGTRGFQSVAARVRARGGWKLPASTVASLLVFFGGWYLLRHYALSDSQRFLLPAPHDVWGKGFADADVRREIFDALLVTAKEAGVGLLVAVILGVVFGALMSQAKWIERSFYPWAIVLQTVPILAIVPLLDLWAKNDILFVKEGFRSRIIVIVIIALFPIISNTFFGLVSADAMHHDLFTANGASRWTRFHKLELPGAMPAMFTGFRISAGLCVVGAIIGEYFFRVGEQGLGQLLDKYTKSGTSEYPQLYATIAVCVALGVVTFAWFGWLGRRIAHWHVSHEVPVI
jgi:NitT/TauT family transport system permease protein